MQKKTQLKPVQRTSPLRYNNAFVFIAKIIRHVLPSSARVELPYTATDRLLTATDRLLTAKGDLSRGRSPREADKAKLSSWQVFRVRKASSLSQNDRKMYSFLEVMIAIAFGMKSAVFSFVMHRMWLHSGCPRGKEAGEENNQDHKSATPRMHTFRVGEINSAQKKTTNKTAALRSENAFFGGL